MAFAATRADDNGEGSADEPVLICRGEMIDLAHARCISGGWSAFERVEAVALFEGREKGLKKRGR